MNRKKLEKKNKKNYKILQDTKLGKKSEFENLSQNQKNFAKFYFVQFS